MQSSARQFWDRLASTGIVVLHCLRTALLRYSKINKKTPLFLKTFRVARVMLLLAHMPEYVSMKDYKAFITARIASDPRSTHQHRFQMLLIARHELCREDEKGSGQGHSSYGSGGRIVNQVHQSQSRVNPT